ncbi:hypothetical protein COC60_24770 [Bacillus thuringiensis]|jgi:uncharacterized protein YjeT (DUF2065 family)|uniref:Methylamine utilisation protein MauE domain-containing protein n=1 Tax=Bacillus cereus TaxID=1396 RepID=A0A9W7Q679_BACCE|nr:MauE/DoxX family redox-associated membrane protein [Bacillus cereus]AXR15607.1 hypothetical protein DOS87_05625 [Bacillus sp. CR71]AXR21341.1 hypothetical protein DPQ26_05615 [Bacillus sp. E25]MRC30046.1 hypothetical protein [Bacillus thuringiensis]OUA52196.1 hypothetical protein BK785_20765 [Bacillus thuringiensis serovar bolivia]OUA71831.1 hypothetical protein BK787_25115 [Bacillus thuringiensis serovar pahangi]
MQTSYRLGGIRLLNVITLIFSVSVGLLFFISGLFKLIAIKEASQSIVEMNLMPEKLASIFGMLFPFLEIFLGVSLIIFNNNMFINIIAIGLIVMFILINFKVIVEKKQKKCFCFGKIIETKLGYGGLIQCLLLLLSIIPNIIFNGTNLSTVLTHKEHLMYGLEIIIISVFWTITLILIRLIFEIIFPNKLSN